MTVINVSYTPDPEDEDPDDDSGLKEPAFVALMDSLIALGADNIDITRAPAG